MVGRRVEVGMCYELEMSMEEMKVVRISREPSAVRTIIGQKQPENAEYF